MAYFYIQVETESNYKDIRIDKWGTPVRTNVHEECTKYESHAEALDVLKKFKLVETNWVHKIRLARSTAHCVWDDTVYSYCSLKKNNKGILALDVSPRF